MSEAESSAPKRMIYDTQNHVKRLRNEFWQQYLQGEGNISEELQADLVSAALTYRDVLIDYRDYDELNPPWRERDLDWIVEAADEYVQGVRMAPGRSKSAKASPKARLLEEDPRRIYRFTKKLDQVAHELGFAAPPTKNRRPKGRIEIPEDS